MFKQSLLNGGVIGPMITAEDRVLTAAEIDIPYRADGRFTQLEINTATMAKMTGPRASRPSWACVRKTILRVRSDRSTAGSWRSWPRANEGSIHA